MVGRAVGHLHAESGDGAEGAVVGFHESETGVPWLSWAGPSDDFRTRMVLSDPADGFAVGFRPGIAVVPGWPTRDAPPGVHGCGLRPCRRRSGRAVNARRIARRVIALARTRACRITASGVGAGVLAALVPASAVPMGTGAAVAAAVAVLERRRRKGPPRRAAAGRPRGQAGRA